MRFSNDVDLLKWEPTLFRDGYLRSQTLAEGDDGQLDGVTFTAANGQFESRGTRTGHVIHLRDGQTQDGSYEIVSVDSETQLTVSVVRADEEDNPVAPPAGLDLHYRISTFDPQAEAISGALLQYLGIRPEIFNGQGDVPPIPALRQPSAMMVLMRVLSMHAGSTPETARMWDQIERYFKLFNVFCETMSLELDSNHDGVPDTFIRGHSLKLARA